VLPPSDGTLAVLPLHFHELIWWFNETNFSFLQKFLSPYLTAIIISTSPLGDRPTETVEIWRKLPDKAVPAIRSAIKAFPSSAHLICLKLGVGVETRFTEEISAFVLGCGEALQELSTNTVLSTQAIVHLMKLPNLRTWLTWQDPPQVTDLIYHGVPDDTTVSLFPSLWMLDLRGGVALEWLSLFGTAKSRTPPWIMAGDSLHKVSYHHPTAGLPMSSSLVSKFLPFTDLVDLRIRMTCVPFTGPCASKFTDKDVEHLAIALPKLETLMLSERPCNSDMCPTTIRSLLFLSVHCTRLTHLNIHFRTGNLRADILDMLGDAYLQGLHSRPKCALKTLVTQEMHFYLSDYDHVLVPMTLLMIFPSLSNFESMSPAWGALEALVKLLGWIQDLAVLTERLVRCLGEARVQSVGNPGVPARSAVSSPLSFGLTGKRVWVCTVY